ncbi:DsbA family protein [Marinomonas mediterranea]|uniref:DsbA family protein n=1 Tax=Marinomonas mediterranea TaxID=119864 RepID=UPI002349C2DB|nr:DsbA family protein [Marinomonas mediterranea]WCN07714.1 DsbA family protein [Marinomonas mediterranea]WCN11815.1 DsbA family protein [Marinomonas mediterranea]
MPNVILHYVNDPLCGWCYGASPLILAANELECVHVTLHCGGLWIGDRRQKMGPKLQQFVLPHDKRIAEMSGLVFGDRYQHELLKNEDLILDSEPPIRAIIVSESLENKGLQMYAAIQNAHYQDGRYVSDINNLAEIAEEVGLRRDRFLDEYLKVDLASHLSDSLEWLRKLQGQGYPTVGLEIDGVLSSIEVSRFLGKTDQFKQHIEALLAR